MEQLNLLYPLVGNAKQGTQHESGTQSQPGIQLQQDADTRGGGAQPPDLPNISAVLTDMTAQMESIEASMEARARGATTGQDQPTEAYGSQVYASVGSSLEEVQQTSSETVDRLQVPCLRW